MERKEKVVIIVTPEEKAAIVALAGGKGEVGRFIRYLCHQAAILKGEDGLGEALGKEFQEITVKAVRRMVDAAIKAAKAQEGLAVRPDYRTLNVQPSLPKGGKARK
jgi:ribulose kinase